MQFFNTLKQQHISLLGGLSTDRIEYRMLAVLLTITFASAGVLFGVFGTDILNELIPVFEAESGTAFPLETSMMPWVFALIAVLDMVSEFFWIVLVTYITRRVLKYLKKPLLFKHVFNIYLLIRIYEMATSFAILLGVTVVSLYMNETLPWLAEEEGGVLSLITSFIVPVGFMWLYISSVKRVMPQSADKK